MEDGDSEKKASADDQVKEAEAKLCTALLTYQRLPTSSSTNSTASCVLRRLVEKHRRQLKTLQHHFPSAATAALNRVDKRFGPECSPVHHDLLLYVHIGLFCPRLLNRDYQQIRELPAHEPFTHPALYSPVPAVIPSVSIHYSAYCRGDSKIEKRLKLVSISRFLRFNVRSWAHMHAHPHRNVWPIECVFFDCELTDSERYPTLAYLQTPVSTHGSLRTWVSMWNTTLRRSFTSLAVDRLLPKLRSIFFQILLGMCDAAAILLNPRLWKGCVKAWPRKHSPVHLFCSCVLV